MERLAIAQRSLLGSGGVDRNPVAGAKPLHEKKVCSLECSGYRV